MCIHNEPQKYSVQLLGFTSLVVKKTPANKYEGATIIPLDWAYADARVVARPNSEWLDIKNNKIEGNKEL